jgi:PAS domain S-box-containing protein
LAVEWLLKDTRFLMNIFETMRDGLMVMDGDGNILYFNRAAEDITGYRREEVIGRPCTILDTDTCGVLTESGEEKMCELFKSGMVRNKKCRMRSRFGSAVYLLKNAVILKDNANKIIGAVETITDITSLYMKELELEELKQELRQEHWFVGLLGKSLAMQRLYEQIRNAAQSEAPVLICGESGTGKELAANAIHALSRRKDGPLVKLNCAALNEHLLESELFGHKKGSFTGAISDKKGKFETADGGTFFLDEIGDMPFTMQSKLLRVLEEKVVERVGENTPVPVDIRLISATNKDLYKLESDGRFREDLLYRVNSIFIKIPPLRERKDDIPMLVAHYLKKISLVNNKDIRRINPRAMEAMGSCRWPGNVRQLINALEHCAITSRGDTIEVSDLPEYIFRSEKAEKNEARGMEDNIRTALAMHNGNKTLAAKHLGISRVTLWKKLKESGIEKH